MLFRKNMYLFYSILDHSILLHSTNTIVLHSFHTMSF